MHLINKFIAMNTILKYMKSNKRLLKLAEKI